MRRVKTAHKLNHEVAAVLDLLHSGLRIRLSDLEGRFTASGR